MQDEISAILMPFLSIYGKRVNSMMKLLGKKNYEPLLTLSLCMQAFQLYRKVRKLADNYLQIEPHMKNSIVVNYSLADISQWM